MHWALHSMQRHQLGSSQHVGRCHCCNQHVCAHGPQTCHELTTHAVAAMPCLDCRAVADSAAISTLTTLAARSLPPCQRPCPELIPALCGSASHCHPAVTCLLLCASCTAWVWRRMRRRHCRCVMRALTVSLCSISPRPLCQNTADCLR